MVQLAAQIWADGPAADPVQPLKKDIRDWGTWLEGIVNSFTSNGGLIYTTRAALFADLAHDANTMAWVIGDATVAYNGIYAKTDVSGSGSWSRVADLPYSFIVATDAGDGTANAIQATSSLPISGGVLVWFYVFRTNTSSPVTISFNGEPPLTIKTNSGNDPAPGGLAADTVAMGIMTGTTFQLISDQASAAIQAAAEASANAAAASAAQAAEYADFARNNWALLGPFSGTGAQADYLLSIDPGSANNMFVVVGGVLQLLSQSAYSLVYTAAQPYIRINVPLGVIFDVRVSNAIPVNTPADGSVSTGKLADGAVTDTKLASALAFTGKTITGGSFDSPALTGNPTAPTAAPGDNDTSIATTAFVAAAIAALVNSSPSTLDTLKELADALGDDPNFATTMTTALGLKAPLASPTFTGTVTVPNASFTYGKLQNVSTTTRLLGRASAGAGVIEELTPAQLRDLFFPTGSVVDSVVGTYALNADLTTIIPFDDTVPQSTEGTQIISVTITPKSTTNKLRVRIAGFGTSNTALNLIWAIFNGGASAISAGSTVVQSGVSASFVGEVEYVPGSLSTQTISLRIGPDTANTIRLNGVITARRFGGVATTVLVVEEIKA